MDPRRVALKETLELLQREGWAPQSGSSTLLEDHAHPRHSIFQRPIVKLCCVLSFMLNLILISGWHAQGLTSDLHSSLQLTTAGGAMGPNGQNLLLTVDGKSVWEQTSQNGSTSINFADIGPIEFDAKCVVQLWRLVDHPQDKGRDKILLDQWFIKASQPSAQPTEIQVRLNDVLYYRWLAQVTNSKAAVAH